jgi:hypothetical protein
LQQGRLLLRQRRLLLWRWLLQRWLLRRLLLRRRLLRWRLLWWRLLWWRLLWWRAPRLRVARRPRSQHPPLPFIEGPGRALLLPFLPEQQAGRFRR